MRVVPPWEVSGPIVWGNLTVDLWNQMNGGPLTPLPIPANTTLQVFAPSESISPPYGPLVADYNLSASRWASGASALVEDGQWLLLQGMIPPGIWNSTTTSQTYSGPSLVVDYSNGGQLLAIVLPLHVY